MPVDKYMLFMIFVNSHTASLSVSLVVLHGCERRFVCRYTFIETVSHFETANRFTDPLGV